MNTSGKTMQNSEVLKVWNHFETQNNPVPNYLKNVLNIMGYDNIALISKIDVKEIEEFVRTDLHKFISESGDPCEFYGPVFGKASMSKNEFIIVPGHRRLLEEVIKYCATINNLRPNEMETKKTKSAKKKKGSNAVATQVVKPKTSQSASNAKSPKSLVLAFQTALTTSSAEPLALACQLMQKATITCLKDIHDIIRKTNTPDGKQKEVFKFATFITLLTCVKSEDNRKEEAKVKPVQYDENQWSPHNQGGKKVYDRDFLIQLRDYPNSKMKPKITVTAVLASQTALTTSSAEPLALACQLMQKATITCLKDIHDIIRKTNTPDGKQKEVFKFATFITLLTCVKSEDNRKEEAKVKPVQYDENQWSQHNQGGKKVYDRDFLIQLRDYPNSKMKPKITLSAVFAGNKRTLCFPFVHSKQNSQQGLNWRTELISEEDRATEILYRNVRAILNKLTLENYIASLKQIKILPIETSERLQGVIDLVFEKAVDEPNFSVAYALMCRELALMQVPVNAESKEFVNFRKLLVTRCQIEFEQNSSEESNRNGRMTEIEHCSDPEKKKEMLVVLAEDDRRIRMKSVGNIRFIGELFKQQILTTSIMMRCLFNLIENEDEGRLECLGVLLMTIGKELDAKNIDLSKIFDQLRNIVERKDGKVCNRVRFILQDVIDLRARGWVPRSESLHAVTGLPGSSSLGNGSNIKKRSGQLTKISHYCTTIRKEGTSAGSEFCPSLED